MQFAESKPWRAGEERRHAQSAFHSVPFSNLFGLWSLKRSPLHPLTFMPLPAR